MEIFRSWEGAVNPIFSLRGWLSAQPSFHLAGVGFVALLFSFFSDRILKVCKILCLAFAYIKMTIR